ncbi:glutamate receptor 2.5-like [Sesamum indicum]|uniref:Glutamate receptor n=1 Tax=Sesamum indicum TaxID=4182 RepID=A0A8M8UU88_SESIN|nr:glutamate receptor 2.5-like [Sesamum indicum]
MLNNVMKRSHFFVIIHILILLYITTRGSCHVARDVAKTTSSRDEMRPLPIRVGVVLDLNSPLDVMADFCMKTAVSDFYAANPNYNTELQLHTKYVGSVVDAYVAVLELLEKEEVHGIIRPPGYSTEETFFTELGQRVHVPIISFTARSSALSYTGNHYSIRTRPNDAIQAQALAVMCRGFEWSEVVVLYEDTEFGNQFLSHINKAFEEVEIGLAYMVAFPRSAEDSYLLKELNKLSTKQTRVFVVHMNPSLGFRLFALAKSEGLLSEGFAWIITDSISNFMNSVDSITRDSMQGVLGVRPHVPSSDALKSLQQRWKRSMILENTTSSITDLNVHGLWAYDAVTALAIAIENIKPVNASLFSVKTTRNCTEKRKMRISTLGPKLLSELSSTKFTGLSGDFQLVDGELRPSAFEIFNVIGTGEKTIGYWTSDRGIKTELSQSTSTAQLKSIMWPGDSVIRPKGWAIPTTGNLRVGIPSTRGYKEFVDVIIDPTTKHANATGFSIDMFLATLEVIPFPVNYEFHHYNDTENIDWTYDDMLHEIPQRFDMVVGDTTIWAPRAAYVDFALPYSESGVILVVKNKKPFDMWIFVKPLKWDLWLTIIMICIYMGIVLHILEHRATNNDTDSSTSKKERARMVYWSPLAVLAFPERNMVSNKWSFFILLVWLFMAFILMQSYTANLSAILTVDQLKFAFSDNYYIGCQEGSFMKQFLTEQLHISALRLRTYSSPEEYHKAMSLGSQNEGIDAIFDEIPYMKVFLNKYDSQYKMVGPTYRTGGFGFAFPIGSPLVSHFSKAILDVTQGPNMTFIEQKNFGPGYSSQDPLSSSISQQTSSLTVYDFAGLFVIVGSVTILALLCSETTVGRKITDMAKHFICNCYHSTTTQVNSMENANGDGDSRSHGSLDEEIHHSTQNSVSNPEENTDRLVIGEMELREIGQSNETSCAD